MAPKQNPKKTKNVMRKRRAKRASGPNKGSTNIQQKVQGDKVLQKLTGLKSASRAQYVSRIWKYIKDNKLQKPGDGRIVIPDKKMATLTGHKGQEMNAFTISKYIEQHIVKNN